MAHWGVRTQVEEEKVEFLEELLLFRGAHAGPWLLCGDFNMIYRAQDKNNGRLDRRGMRRFKCFLNRAQVDEIPLLGRSFTWSNRRERPTLELLDRMFASVEWLGLFPRHTLRPLSSNCSDHCPLLLLIHAFQGIKRRFRFESFWVRIPGFKDVVAEAWASEPSDADPFRVLDQKLRKVATELRRWNDSRIGNVRLQLAVAREVILRFDEEQERRVLEGWEQDLHRALKLRVLGLASLQRTIARQRSRLLFLRGDANTRFFNLQACHRNRQNRIAALRVHEETVVTDHAMGSALYDYFNGLLGVNFHRSRRFNLEVLGLPTMQLDALEVLFTEEEIWAVIKDLPNDKAPGPDGFTALFYKMTWDIIKPDIINAFNAFWSQDFRSLHHLNGAFMILLKKKEHPEEIRDYRPISLIHSFGKLISKCLVTRLAAVLGGLVMPNQSAFIKGRSIHDNFRDVYVNCKQIHRRRTTCVLRKIDVAKAFDTVAWVFLLEVLQHLGFGRRWRNWIAGILSSASTKILLNGQPGKRICHARGLRQGDLLSPMLFVLAMDVLNRFLVWVEQNAYLTPVVGLTGPRASLYADDLVLFLVPNEGDLLAITAALRIFGLASGLECSHPDTLL